MARFHHMAFQQQQTTETPETLQLRLIELARQRQALLDEMEYQKRFWPLAVGVFSALSTRSTRHLQETRRDLVHLRRELARLNTQMVTLQEQQVALLFLVCLKEELEQLSNQQLGISSTITGAHTLP